MGGFLCVHLINSWIARILSLLIQNGVGEIPVSKDRSKTTTSIM